MSIVFMFPGQNSRYAEMIEKAAAVDKTGSVLLEHASDALGRDLERHYRSDNPAIFQRNRDVQVGVFLANHLYAALLRHRDVVADFSLGLSLGEYNHLVDIGAISFEEALLLVEARGVAYELAPDGGMAAVFPVDIDEIHQLLAQLDHGGDLTIAMHNAPRQYVLSGARLPLEAAIRLIEDGSVAQVAVIEERLPMHSSLFDKIADRFRATLESVTWNIPRRPYLPNVLGEFVVRPCGDDFVSLLSDHLRKPVLWRQSIQEVCATAPDPILVEVGPKTVLHDLLGRRWVSHPRYKTDSADDFERSLDQLCRELHGES